MGLLFSVPLQRCPTSFWMLRVCPLDPRRYSQNIYKFSCVVMCDVLWEQTSTFLFIALIHATTQTLFLVENITQNATRPAETVCSANIIAKLWGGGLFWARIAKALEISWKCEMKLSLFLVINVLLIHLLFIACYSTREDHKYTQNEKPKLCVKNTSNFGSFIAVFLGIGIKQI